ncbi:type I phosphomannose isomerase catalytic subunit [Brevibacillus massiliensis]|uniref:type I phosphomannose isomerase catalytic subunit n=1 Tax=Brevibacillus massiliensis TaxID=1118054 RepID=UPI0009D9E14E|nr:type I phosphomannose isomerase catalytic subunit [Brevibacillus massiliensis]
MKRIWGGHQLKEWFSVRDDQPIGEYWLVSSHPVGVSVVQNGALRGKSLPELTELFPEAYLGRSPQKRFPLLIKMIEAQDDLSVQVHPNDDYAKRTENDYGKTEAWYIVDPGPGAEIIYGHRFKDRDHFLQSVQAKSIQPFLERKKIERDQLVYVPAGTVHAILKGTMLLEIQQTSDVTYRVYDWDRLDQNGTRRELHIRQAADVIDYRSGEREPLCRITPISRRDGVSHDHLLSCPFFTVERIKMENNSRFTCSLGRAGNPDVLVILEGEGCIDYGQGRPAVAVQRGDAVLVPGTLPTYGILAWTHLKIVRTYYSLIEWRG